MMLSKAKKNEEYESHAMRLHKMHKQELMEKLKEQMDTRDQTLKQEKMLQRDSQGSNPFKKAEKKCLHVSFHARGSC